MQPKTCLSKGLPKDLRYTGEQLPNGSQFRFPERRRRARTNNDCYADAKSGNASDWETETPNSKRNFTSIRTIVVNDLVRKHGPHPQMNASLARLRSARFETFGVALTFLLKTNNMITGAGGTRKASPSYYILRSACSVFPYQYQLRLHPILRPVFPKSHC